MFTSTISSELKMIPQGYRSKEQRDNPSRITVHCSMLYFSCFPLSFKARKVTIEKDVDAGTKAVCVPLRVEKKIIEICEHSRPTGDRVGCYKWRKKETILFSDVVDTSP